MPCICIKPSKTTMLLCVSFIVTMLTGCAGGGQDGGPPGGGGDNVKNERKHYVNFESVAVRPIATSPNGKRVYITNTPNQSLEIFEFNVSGELEYLSAVSVGIEPVAVAVRGNGDAWVVNHLSDSVSIVAFDKEVPYVRQTLLVGDEPSDIVFAKNRAFITTAHRGQQRNHTSLKGVSGAGDPQLHSADVSRADVWVFDVDNTGGGIGGIPVKIIELFGDTPRALAVTPDEEMVYVSILNSGNQTSVVHESVMCYGFEDDELGSKPCQVLDKKTSPNGLANGMLPGGRTAPGVNKDGVPQPWTSMVVKYDNESGEWRDTKGRNFSNGIRFSLSDNDVFSIDSNTLNMKQAYRHVGTTLFNMAVNPNSGSVYVSNTEANNATRFEGPGIVGGSTVQGNIARTRITVIKPTENRVTPRALNRHIPYEVLKSDSAIKQHSIANPTQLVISNDGSTVYMAAMGSNKIAVYPTNQLEDDAYWDNNGIEFDPKTASKQHISVTGGPVGLLLDESRKKLLTYTRFDNSLVVVDLDKVSNQTRIALSNPEPAKVIAGRSMLYDASRSSSNGEASCASCHIFGDTDHLSWNLGNPDSSNAKNPQPFPTFKFSTLGCDFVGPEEQSCQLLDILNGDGDRLTIASMKGPMFTQTLRGMSTHGHMHWRGDRSVGYFGTDTEKDLDEKTSYKNFIVAFEGLLGMDIELPANVNAADKSPDVVKLEKDIDTFADFILATQMPPNPIRPLSNGLSASAAIGKAFFLGERRSDGLADDSNKNGPEQDGVNCEGCHGLNVEKGFYGTRGEVAHGGEVQIFKVPQLRNLYTRVGMFGLPDREGFLPSHTNEHQGEQIRGFGFLHDGATDGLINFLRGGVFDNGEEPCKEGNTPAHGCEFNAGFVGIPDETVRQGLVDFMMEFDSDLAPIVGQQITLPNQPTNEQWDRLSLLEEKASTPFTSKILGGDVRECDLMANGLVSNTIRGYLFDHQLEVYQSDKKAEQISVAGMRKLIMVAGNALTFTCLVPGSGVQLAIDIDLDGSLNGDRRGI